MRESPAAQKLTESLITAVRLQRHLACRVIIATQEPTISPRLLDLCSFTLVHRFTSPDWLKVLRNHLAAASLETSTARHVLRLGSTSVQGIGQNWYYPRREQASLRGTNLPSTNPTPTLSPPGYGVVRAGIRLDSRPEKPAPDTRSADIFLVAVPRPPNALLILLKFIGYTRHEFSGDIYEFKDVAKQRGELCFNHFVDDVVYKAVLSNL